MGIFCETLNIEIGKWSYQAIGGIKEINVMRRKDFFADNYDKAYKQQCSIRAKIDFIGALPNRIIESSCIIGMMGVIALK